MFYNHAAFSKSKQQRNLISTSLFQIGEVKVPLCMVDLAQTIEEWKDIQSVKVDDQVGGRKMLIKHDIDSE